MLPIIRPMLAVEGEPFDSSDFVFEVKWDGFRALVYVDNDVRIMSRNGKDLSERFPEITEAFRSPMGPGIIDGEIIILNDQGKPDFALMQRRGRAGHKGVLQTVAANPASFVAFDLPFWKESLIQEDLITRQERLSQVIAAYGQSERLVLSTVISTKGKQFFAAVVEQGLEGVMAKKKQSPYLPGQRSNNWVKIKNRLELDCVIGGYLPSTRGFKSLFLGLYDRSLRLIYVGNVGIGFAQGDMDQLMQGFARIKVEQCPFFPSCQLDSSAVWLKPIMVASVEYLEFTRDQRLRHPVFHGLRWDKRPEECQWLTGK